MDKRVQNRLKRDELDKIIKKYPTLNDFLQNVTDEDRKNPDLQAILEPVIADMLEKARMNGVYIGYSAGLIGAYQRVKECNGLREAIKILHDGANDELHKTGVTEDVDSIIKWQEFDKNV